MLARPNHTVVEGTVRAVRPHPEGQGIAVELTVSKNVSPAKADDFIRPEAGQVLSLFAAEEPTVSVGQKVRAHAQLLAGPFGSRTVLQQIDALK